MSKHSRRAVLAGIATAPALAAPALALGSSIEPDPIFAAIDRHKTAVGVRTAAMLAENDAPNCPASAARNSEATDREFAVMDELFATRPTTVLGVAALLDHLAVSHYAPDGAPWSDDPPLMDLALDRGEVGDNVMVVMSSALRAIGNVSKAARAPAAVAKADPVFAAIEDHKRAWDEWCASSEADPRWDELGDAHSGAQDRLLMTVPTTRAGAIALIDHVEKFERNGSGCSMLGKYTPRVPDEGADRLLATLRTALENLNAHEGVS
jgi:hypothetical protein